MYVIEKKTPAIGWLIIHRNMSYETARYMLEDFAKNYDADDNREYESSLSDDGLFLSAYEGGDLHEFRIVNF